MSTAPLMCRWTGDGFIPLGRSAKDADATFVIGERYTLVEVQDRSIASHNHYFAALHEAWKNLTDEQVERWPTSDHLRAFALIKTGYATQRQFVAASKAEAQRLAVFLRPTNEYALITVSECVVTEWTAESQSFRAMGKTRFNESKTAVLEYVAGLISVTADELVSNSGRAA
jgi:hypothetical protein